MNWREYHEATKHSVESLRRRLHSLDWVNMPDPFRHYEGVPARDLPADPVAPSLPALDVLRGIEGTPAAPDGATFLSSLLFHSAAISATKIVPSTGYRYALRVNPSSGNLHPTEFHFVGSGLKSWPDGLYHYRPSEHTAEQRALGRFEMSGCDDYPMAFVLTSIFWREAWKYGERAYRYCLHDIGHAWESLNLAARALGCETVGVGQFIDDDVARTCGFAADESPMLIVGLRGQGVPTEERRAPESAWLGGNANRLSAVEIEYPEIAGVHASCKVLRSVCGEWPGDAQGSGERLGLAAESSRPFAETVRSRRSAVDFRGGEESMSAPQLAAILDAARRPFTCDFDGERLVTLYLYVHRVDGLKAGVYRYWPQTGELELRRLGDQRVVAAGLSLGQDLAGNACVAFSMVGALDEAARVYGDRGYRYAHFTAGAVGQRMYVAAEALGLRATGIGAFFDDRVNDYLALDDGQQTIYHFAIGYPVRDLRLEA